MSKFPLVMVALASVLAAVPLAAMAQQDGHATPQKPAPQAQKPAPQAQRPVRAQDGARRPAPGVQGAQGGAHVATPGPQGTHVGRVPGGRGPGPGAAYHGRPPAHTFAGHAYHGNVAWGRGNWRHEMHNGRMGWWWDVGGVWYFYPERFDGPPAYVSEVEFMDDPYADADGYPPDGDGPPPPPGAYGPPPGAYGPPPGVVYAPPPPPPPPPGPDAVGGAIGGAILGGLLGGAVSGRPGGAVAGALIGGTTGAVIASEAERRRGYYWWRGNCYYRYPSGEYSMVGPDYCQ